MKTGLIYTDDYLLHDTGNHPEHRERYVSVINGLMSNKDVWDELSKHRPRLATDEEILRCHDLQTITHVTEACGNCLDSRAHLDQDTVVSAQSDYAARLAAGGTCLAIDQVMEGDLNRIFVACRPPGHHATPNQSMGFCLYNNVAIGARYAQSKYSEIKNVLIVDFDVHHGNGTQDIFYDDPSVFYYSLHQYPWYPGTGAANERGSNAGEGYTLNVPISPNTTATEYLRQFEVGLEHIARHFTPDLILVSAGFDAHIADPLGQLTLTNNEYEAMTRRLAEWADAACQGRFVSCLEGGYNLQTLGGTVRTHVEAML
ncbi:MAG: histone deacetylase [Acidobacteria bacterium]|nr:histone deacetylase [Acidobacteriota bacterium]